MKRIFAGALLVFALVSLCRAEPAGSRRVLPARSKGKAVDAQTMQRIYEQIKTPYKYGVILKGQDGRKLDCPSVYRHGEKWCMMYIIFDGNGYETAIAESDNLLDWKPLGKILSFRKGDRTEISMSISSNSFARMGSPAKRESRTAEARARSATVASNRSAVRKTPRQPRRRPRFFKVTKQPRATDSSFFRAASSILISGDGF